ncbi:MAG: hypothetical protein WEC33_00020 [Dehalococcoidia bacterium]
MDELPLDDVSLALARRYGQLLTAAAGIFAVVYTVGLLRKNYWALALPLTMIVAAALALVFTLGRLLATTPDPAPDP